ncbi:hypothetical protein HpHCM43_03420 [Helicobacter pylori]|uniref:GTPase n=1 Tax=Helicobacter pylori TaxID=210 RepID=UPI0039D2EB18
MIAIKDAHFLTSSSQLSQCPASLTSEMVILGRSNVGKSSFINTFVLGSAKRPAKFVFDMEDINEENRKAKLKKKGAKEKP